MSGGFSGSYEPSDVTFLLKTIRMEPLELEHKEKLIQSGARHYSELIGREAAPSPEYLEAFESALGRNRRRFAADLSWLAARIDRARRGAIALVSFARAGTPIGVLLTRILRKRHGRTVDHYSISIIRDRGIDENALLHILRSADESGLVFVDGWTGKGAIAGELERSLSLFERAHGRRIEPELFVVADLCGRAAIQATTEDYLIPSAILNGTISGLVSRSILNDAHVGARDFHGCLYLSELEAHDRSRAFVNDIEAEVERAVDRRPQQRSLEAVRIESRTFVERLVAAHGVDPSYVKPGIGEATRVLLRRSPGLLLVRDVEDEDVGHLLLLAEERRVRVVEAREMPYKAAALIARVPPEARASG